MPYTPMNYQGYGGYGQPYQYPTALPQQTMNPMQSSLPQQTQNGFGCRPVTSREEALGVQVDFFSPGTVMPDLAHGTIYLKRFNQNTGASDLFEFRVVEPQPEQPDEMQQLREAVRRLEQEVAALKQKEAVPDE